MPNFIQQQQKNSKATATVTSVQEERVEGVSGRLSLYAEPPDTAICIEDFEHYSIDRLRGGHRSTLYSIWCIMGMTAAPRLDACAVGC